MAVILIHVVSGTVSNATVPLDVRLTGVLHAVHMLMNWSVPVFFMITGYCILGKESYTYQAAGSKVLKYVLVLFTVGLSFALLEEFFIQRTISLPMIFRSLGHVVSGNLWDHMWYVYAIIGIYLVLPVLHLFMKTDAKNRWILTGLLFVFTVLLPTLAPWMTLGVEFPFGGYCFYVCFGGMVAYGDLGKKAKYGALICGVAALLWMLCHHGQDFGYLSLPICLLAGSIFVGFSSIPAKPNRLVLSVSQCTWGIYLLHPLFINVATKLLHIDFLSHMPYLKLTVFAPVVFLLSLGTTYGLRNIPILKKLF